MVFFGSPEAWREIDRGGPEGGGGGLAIDGGATCGTMAGEGVIPMIGSGVGLDARRNDLEGFERRGGS